MSRIFFSQTCRRAACHSIKKRNIVQRGKENPSKRIPKHTPLTSLHSRHSDLRKQPNKTPTSSIHVLPWKWKSCRDET
uniref:Uncharacterized protein n=1 Tax=Arundo donax TaxID=35708 RepID=A0A0A9EJU5_ARUDO